MTTWPASPFPQSPLADGYGWSPRSNVIRDPVDAGTAQTRRRHTATVAHVTASYWLTSAQLSQWNLFYSDTIAHGALWFDWPEPVSETTKTARMMDVPRITPISGGIRWRLDLQIEVVL